jgi:hypothetical protein
VAVATVLWLAAVAAGAAGIVLTLIDLDQVRSAVLAEVTRQFPNELPATMDRVGTAVLTVVLSGGALILVLQLGFTLAMRSRRRWARIALVLVGLMGVGHGLIAAGVVLQPLLVGLPAAAALAGAAAMFLPQSNVWFAHNSGWGGRR